MLKSIRKQHDMHRQALLNCVGHMREHPLSTLGTMMVLAITLTLPALFLTGLSSIQKISHNWKVQGQLSVYFEPGLEDARLNTLQAEIHNMRGVADTQFISAQEGLESLRKDDKMMALLQDLPHNPLPAVSIVIPSLQLQQSEQLEALQNRIMALHGVAMVSNDVQWLHKLQAMFHVIQQIALFVIVLLGIAVLLIIANTLRLEVQNHTEEIRILQLIGASDAYILRPFMYAGLLYGGIAAILAIVLSNMCLSMLALSTDRLAQQYDMAWPLQSINGTAALSVLLFALGLGWVAARISAKKQLRRIASAI
jgi:cell division transport system permease protein